VPLQPIRTPTSEQLDNQEIRRRGGDVITIPAAQSWTPVYRMLERNWKVGQHMALCARSGSGKTTAARALLDIRDWVVVFGTKPRDQDLYPEFERKGYIVKEKWEPTDLDDPRVIFRPAGGGLTDTEPQRKAFTRALEEIYEVGGWTVYIDEMLVLSRDLGMERVINRMYTQARSNGVTMVAGTQRPRGAPLNMFEQSEWFCLWRIADMEDRARASEYLGPNRWMAYEATAMLPRYEFLVVNTATDYATRTKVGT
jgi:hypothetical protein